MAAHMQVMKNLVAKNLFRSTQLNSCLGAFVFAPVRISPGQTTSVLGCQLRPLHSSASLRGLNEFFEEKDDWGKSSIKTGAPWRTDELRLKSSSDLHKLWYVLLKERNKLMTMEEMCKEAYEPFPSPERMEKVEESMENLIEVIQERDRVVNQLETGKTGEPFEYEDTNILGMQEVRTAEEHAEPEHLNPEVIRRKKMSGRWQQYYLKRWEEKQLRHKRWEANERRKKLKKLREIFPDADYDNWEEDYHEVKQESERLKNTNITDENF